MLPRPEQRSATFESDSWGVWLRSRRDVAWVFAILLAVVTCAYSFEGPDAGGTDRLLKQAQALQAQGKTQEALKAYDSVLQELSAGEPSARLGLVLNARARLHAADGDYAAAIASAQRSADAYHAISDREGEALALNSMGIAEIQSGNYVAAQSELSRGLELSREAGARETEIEILNNLGSSFYYRGKYLEALRSYEAAVDVIRRSPNQAWVADSRQLTDFNQATLYQRLGRYQNALEIYRRVIASPGKLSVSERAQLFSNLGALYRRLGDPVKALETYSTALDLYSRQRDADGQIGALKNVGIVDALDLEDLAKGEGIFRRALALAERTGNQREQMQAHLYLGEIALRRGQPEAADKQFHEALAGAKSLGTAEEEWKALFGMGRVLAAKGDDVNAEESYRQAIAIIEKTRVQLQLSALRADFLGDKRDAYDAMIAVQLRRHDIPEAFSFMERSRARTFQDQLAAKGGSPAARPPSLEEAQKLLGASSVLLEFWTSGNRLAVLWCTREASGVAQKEFSGSELDALRAFLDGMPARLTGAWREEINRLGSVLPEDFQFPTSAKHVLLVPDGWVSMLPFDLLPVRKDGNELVIETLDVTYLPSAALLRRQPRTGEIRWPWTRELVAFGNPVTAGGDAGGSGDALRGEEPAASLPHSAEEIESIAKMARGKTEAYLGIHDRKSTFLSGGANRGLLLHVSTHAFADLENAENSRLLFTPEQTEGRPDYVFLREIYGLDLGQVNLATISACDTERGTNRRGEGVQAFSRALLSSGARSSLTTLWRVADRPTAEFMKQFYYYALQKNQPKAEALRLAKLRFLRSDSTLQNPANWAAFVINGDGLTAVPRVLSWRDLVLALAALLGLAGLAAWVGLRSQRGIHRKNRAGRVVAE